MAVEQGTPGRARGKSGIPFSEARSSLRSVGGSSPEYFEPEGLDEQIAVLQRRFRRWLADERAARDAAIRLRRAADAIAALSEAERAGPYWGKKLRMPKMAMALRWIRQGISAQSKRGSVDYSTALRLHMVSRATEGLRAGGIDPTPRVLALLSIVLGARSAKAHRTVYEALKDETKAIREAVRRRQQDTRKAATVS